MTTNKPEPKKTTAPKLTYELVSKVLHAKFAQWGYYPLDWIVEEIKAYYQPFNAFENMKVTRSNVSYLLTQGPVPHGRSIRIKWKGKWLTVYNLHVKTYDRCIPDPGPYDGQRTPLFVKRTNVNPLNSL